MEVSKIKKKLTIGEYMEKHNIKSRQTVYNKIEAGEIQSEKDGNRVYIIDMDTVHSKINELDLLKEKIFFLEEQNKQLSKEKSEIQDEKRELFNLYREVQYKQDELNKVILQIEYKANNKDKENEELRNKLDTVRQELEREKSKKWWQKIF